MKKTTLYKIGKGGKVQIWAAWIDVTLDGTPCIFRESGTENGKMTVKKKFVKKGKNIGKSNETTPLEQAQFEMNNMVKAKLEENMVDDYSKIYEEPKYLYPALAVSHDLKKTEKLLKKRGYLYVQPKLNGARTWNLRHLPENHKHDLMTHVMLSRKLNHFTSIGHIEEVCKGFGSYSPDGEIFHPDYDFQTIISLLKKFYKKGENPDYPDYGTEDLQYHVYDLAIPGKTYEERKEILDEITGYGNEIFKASIKVVETVRVESIKEIDDLHNYWVSLGYEGLIVRDPKSLYAFNDRNDSLIKYKKFYDKEFKIIGHKTELWDDSLNNVERKLVLWECITENGFTFTSRPKGSFLERERLHSEAEKHYGKMLTVRYQELSQDGVPIMNIGICLRDYE
jgi:DNA ligase-1